MVEPEHVRRSTIEDIDSADERSAQSRVEAALFIAGRFLSFKELVALTDVNPVLLRAVLSDLQEKYATSGLRIIARDDLWKMDVVEDHADLVHRLATGSSEFSKAEQETLAIIAYKQPVKQSVLIKIRGNKAYDHVANFVKIGLVTKKKMGHTSELSLTDAFYDYFNLERGQLGEGEGVA